MSTDRLIYLALGGAGEIGMNMYLYGSGRPGPSASSSSTWA